LAGAILVTLPPGLWVSGGAHLDYRNDYFLTFCRAARAGGVMRSTNSARCGVIVTGGHLGYESVAGLACSVRGAAILFGRAHLRRI
jgi:hypothetical protein